MGEINLLDRYPRASRPILERSKLITNEHREVARLFGRDFFDGDRLHGYGGYTYHPRFWTDTVKRMHSFYQLPDAFSVLDIGCGKGFMLYDFQRLFPRCTVTGIDISEYAIANSKEEVRPFLKVGNARSLPFDDSSFDLVIAINTIHNLPLEECKQAIKEISRVSRDNRSFISIDAWRDDVEMERMLAWNLTALTYMHVDDWKVLFSENGYLGDYYWFIAE